MRKRSDELESLNAGACLRHMMNRINSFVHIRSVILIHMFIRSVTHSFEVLLQTRSCTIVCSKHLVTPTHTYIVLLHSLQLYAGADVIRRLHSRHLCQNSRNARMMFCMTPTRLCGTFCCRGVFVQLTQEIFISSSGRRSSTRRRSSGRSGTEPRAVCRVGRGLSTRRKPLPKKLQPRG